MNCYMVAGFAYYANGYHGFFFRDFKVRIFHFALSLGGTYLVIGFVFYGGICFIFSLAVPPATCTDGLLSLGRRLFRVTFGR